MEKYKDIPIFITGAERSGSSIIAKILALSGTFIGETSSMYENKKIKELIIDYYKFIGIDPVGQYPLPPEVNDKPFPIVLKEKIYSILKNEGYNLNKPWLYKSSKICQTWRMWNLHYPEAKWVIVRRKPSDIVYSCCKTTYMYAFSDTRRQKEVGANNEKEAWLWWVKQHEKMFQKMSEANLNYKVIWPEDLVDGNYESVKEILDWVGLPFDEDQIRKEIDPMLWKSRINRKEK